jgi:hypothetical protein
MSFRETVRGGKKIWVNSMATATDAPKRNTAHPAATLAALNRPAAPSSAAVKQKPTGM